MDLYTDFKRSEIEITITDEKTSLLRNNENGKLMFIDKPSSIKGYTNYHLHILFPINPGIQDNTSKPIKGKWSIETLTMSKWRKDKLIGPHKIPVIFEPEIHSSNCERILASTENLMGSNPESDKTDYTKKPHRDRTKIKDVYNICSSLLKVYADMQGKLNYVMIQPYYSSRRLGNTIISVVEFKKDKDNYIAVFPTIPYNKAELIEQTY